mmetsp:Transcript_38096/g.96309  ORF Transcript_38096/g.96309 Transcript_38096/m.96309 type:complete len:154 (+) Transcript_38096:284-745(+)
MHPNPQHMHPSQAGASCTQPTHGRWEPLAAVNKLGNSPKSHVAITLHTFLHFVMHTTSLTVHASGKVSWEACHGPAGPSQRTANPPQQQQQHPQLNQLPPHHPHAHVPNQRETIKPTTTNAPHHTVLPAICLILAGKLFHQSMQLQHNHAVLL